MGEEAKGLRVSEGLEGEGVEEREREVVGRGEGE